MRRESEDNIFSHELRQVDIVIRADRRLDREIPDHERVEEGSQTTDTVEFHGERERAPDQKALVIELSKQVVGQSVHRPDAGFV